MAPEVNGNEISNWVAAFSVYMPIKIVSLFLVE